MAIDLLLAEPVVQQPLHLSFDDRGRLWVVQYIQYPDPAGLREVSRDKVWRVVYDKVPPPPPHALDSPFRGKDKITIHEDSDGDGEFDVHKVFVEGLNLATSVAHDDDGIWVTNPPYLLFYPDADRDDVPDGPPVVHLEGFGLEDTHSIASSLRWGPDGWLYGAQGSTVSGAVRRPGIDKSDADAIKTMGQNVWRYHPERKVYEVFAEGGGNTFGVEIDSKGRVFSGHNGGDTRGFHYVQGGYYQKTFGKHGELTNPYAFGYFPPMKNAKVARFVHQFIIYEGPGGMPERFRGKLLGVDVLHNNLVLSDVIPLGSTFETRDIERPVASEDQHFRPVHIVEAPDGSVFVADWYDSQVNHYKNHEGQIDHERGRVYRVRAKEHVPHFEKKAGLEGALDSLWAKARRGELDRGAGLQAMEDADPFVRLWAVRLLEDLGLFDAEVAERVVGLAATDSNVEVLSQIACTARRVAAEHGLAIVSELAGRGDIAEDPHLPLLVWWALEERCDDFPQAVAELVAGTTALGLDRKAMRRFAMSGRRSDLELCAQLLRDAPDAKARRARLESLEEGFAGRPLGAFPRSLEIELEKSRSWAQLAIRLGQGKAEAIPEAIRFLGLEKVSIEGKRALVMALGEHRDGRVVPALLGIAKDNDKDKELRVAATAALASSGDAAIAQQLLDGLGTLPPSVKAAALDTLTSRRDWARATVEKLDRSEVSPAHIEKIRQLDPALAESWAGAAAGDAGREIARLKKVIARDGGVPKRGEAIFTGRCAACHLMFKKGGHIGPDLTSYQKNDLDTMLQSIVDPSAEIREGFEQVIVRLHDGAVHSGFVTDKDEELVSLRTLAGTERSIPRGDIEEMQVVGVSLMPPGLLAGLDDGQVRDLFAFLRSTTPPY